LNILTRWSKKRHPAGCGFAKSIFRVALAFWAMVLLGQTGGFAPLIWLCLAGASCLLFEQRVNNASADSLKGASLKRKKS